MPLESVKCMSEMCDNRKSNKLLRVHKYFAALKAKTEARRELKPENK